MSLYCGSEIKPAIDKQLNSTIERLLARKLESILIKKKIKCCDYTPRIKRSPFKKKRINVALAAAKANRVDDAEDVPELYETVNNDNFLRCRFECGIPYVRDPSIDFEENMKRHMASRCTSRSAKNPKGKWLGWVDKALKDQKHIQQPEAEEDYDSNIVLINEAIDTVMCKYTSEKHKQDGYTGPRLYTLAQSQIEQFQDQ